MIDFIKKLFSGKNESDSGSQDYVDWKSLEERLNFRIQDKGAFIRALTHSSMISLQIENGDKARSNERLEFLGDAVLNLIVAEFLYHKYPDKPEGELTKMRSALVSRKVCGQVASRLNLGEFILLGNGEEKTGGRLKNSILANLLEAVIGIYYLEAGKEKTKEFIFSQLYVDYEKILKIEIKKNYKGELLEYYQRRYKDVPYYKIRREKGPDHRKLYTMNVLFNGKVIGAGSGKNKKYAEQKAAENALKNIK